MPECFIARMIALVQTLLYKNNPQHPALFHCIKAMSGDQRKHHAEMTFNTKSPGTLISQRFRGSYHHRYEQNSNLRSPHPERLYPFPKTLRNGGKRSVISGKGGSARCSNHSNGAEQLIPKSFSQYSLAIFKNSCAVKICCNVSSLLAK